MMYESIPAHSVKKIKFIQGISDEFSSEHKICSWQT